MLYQYALAILFILNSKLIGKIGAYINEFHFKHDVHTMTLQTVQRPNLITFENSISSKLKIS